MSMQERIFKLVSKLLTDEKENSSNLKYDSSVNWNYLSSAFRFKIKYISRLRKVLTVLRDLLKTGGDDVNTRCNLNTLQASTNMSEGNSMLTEAIYLVRKKIHRSWFA
jgi:hypothetical protein